MANAGIKGSRVGTSLKNVITNLAEPSEKAAHAAAFAGKQSLTGVV
ncbi:MAG: phage tail tape measure protein [Oscillospiraceae bacterium]|nr:phage tail tape measure protein [Oscillospiraceae bacterium]